MTVCKDCKFMDPGNDNRPFCRFNPAQLVNIIQPDGTPLLRALFPVVDPNEDWCGQWQPKILS
jgi:hypothetical protein